MDRNKEKISRSKRYVGSDEEDTHKTRKVQREKIDRRDQKELMHMDFDEDYED